MGRRLQCGFREEKYSVERFFEQLLNLDDLDKVDSTLAGHQECSHECAHTASFSKNYNSITLIQKTISIN